jgi:hypothetical protein
MIMTDPALAMLKASRDSIELSRPRAPRFRFWVRKPAHPMFGTEAYYASQRVSCTDLDFSSVAESGGPRIHATTRNAINGG